MYQGFSDERQRNNNLQLKAVDMTDLALMDIKVLLELQVNLPETKILKMVLGIPPPPLKKKTCDNLFTKINEKFSGLGSLNFWR